MDGGRMAVDVPFENIIRLCQDEDVPGVYDVVAEGFDRLACYPQVECHIVLYPYSRRVNAQHFAFYPFDEYVQEVLSQQRSAYAAVQRQSAELFGLVLGAAIALVFPWLVPDRSFSTESIVSVLGAYAIGKELWDDIERALIQVSKGWRLRYQEGSYRYRLEKRTTLTSYSYLAKRRRYGRSAVLPEHIDYEKQSNSQTLRMRFDMRALQVPPGPRAHVHSIHVDPAMVAALEEEGFLFGVKMSLNRRLLGVTRSLEFFQSIDRGIRGCLDERGDWVDGGVFHRRTLSLGRLKLYVSGGVIPDRTIVNSEVGVAPLPDRALPSEQTVDQDRKTRV
jgi:hypothetical protein